MTASPGPTRLCTSALSNYPSIYEIYIAPLEDNYTRRRFDVMWRLSSLHYHRLYRLDQQPIRSCLWPVGCLNTGNERRPITTYHIGIAIGGHLWHLILHASCLSLSLLRPISAQSKHSRSDHSQTHTEQTVKQFCLIAGQ